MSQSESKEQSQKTKEIKKKKLRTQKRSIVLPNVFFFAVSKQKNDNIMFCPLKNKPFRVYWLLIFFIVHLMTVINVLV